MKKPVKAERTGRFLRAVRHEWFLAVSLATCAIFAYAGERLFAYLTHPVGFAVIFIWLFGVVLGSALAVARHADRVAESLGEPYGTLVLTLSVTRSR